MSRAVLLALLLHNPCPAAASSGYVWEGFERELNWEAETSSAATGRVLDPEHFTEGTHGLRLAYQAVADSARAVYAHGESLDWSPYGALVFDVFNPTDLPGLKIGVVVTTTGRWLAHEAYLTGLQPGWNRDLRVDFRDARWSSAASDFKPVGHLVGRGEVNRVALHVYPGSATAGFLTIDHLRLVRSGLLSAGDFTLNTTLDLTASGGDLAYLPPGLRIRSRDLATLESFESGPVWNSGADGVTVQPATDHVSHGSAGVAVTYPASPDGFDLDLIGLEHKLAGTRQLRLDVFCEGPGASLALILTDAGDETYTAERIWLGHGWNTRIIDFTNQGNWNGAAIDQAVLANLQSVTLNIVAYTPGRMVFDGLAAAAVRLKAAARPGAVLSGSWHPSPGVEFVADVRAQDTWYADRLTAPRGAGPEAWLDAAKLRYDAGGFRSNLLYRKKFTAMDQPLWLLVSPHSFGNEIAGVETAGRIAGFETQALVGSRIEYGTYNSRVPTALGPEQVATARIRKTIVKGTRIGLTHFVHTAKYPAPVTQVARTLNTTGADIESVLEGDGKSLNLALEGAMTSGPRFRPAGVNAPGRDHFYAAGKVAPEWGRLSLSYQYHQFGYDFDGSFMSYGGGWSGQSAEAGLTLEGLPGFAWISRIPVWDKSLAKNLKVASSYWDSRSRDRFLDPAVNRLKPRSTEYELYFYFSNDGESRPHVNVHASPKEFADQWFRTRELEQEISLRVPLVFDVVATANAEYDQTRSRDLTTEEEGRGRELSVSGGLERYFTGNLHLRVGATWIRSKESWEGDWAEPETHARVTAGARQSLGANSLIQVDFGSPPLYGSDFGARDTLNIVTILVRTYI